ncbi:MULTISPECIES: pyruvate kinase [unclassified Clostridium]|uniref:pyruvate kinase n=1 Tax=Clostridium TaxID=1485 RepID=UPI001C8B2B96|nr:MULTISPECIES: pyruvate kinase [unclassified Clostridium]MBX9136558.1 pyruvate kinase [Clostridium sp. K12(2020)]MBX9142961.1 pyruvate kinase [Clostridium sp. K13]MDU2289914.1 pyruvate kinase [Clostridium celatum]MDU4325540.1 pyruvate kinase [Clostridium celatum]
MQKTKMIFTIGPSSDNEEILTEFIKIGMNVARLNFSHGTHETHKDKIELIKKIRTNLNTPTAIMLDIKGPKIRTHNFINDGVELEAGQNFTFICDKEILGDNKSCSITYEELYKDVNIGGTILVDDGLLSFEIIDIQDKNIICRLLNDGIIKNHKGVNVPNVSINLPSVTEKDKDDLIFGCKMEVDFIAASFVRKASDVLEIRDLLNSNNGKNIQIIAKIESQEGVNNIDPILSVADGIMVARGDMGVEIPIERVPIIQKNIIKKCNEAGKIVITATQMLDSMIRNSLPTRAEACDICNAIFDGTDAIMLSGESASGLYPIEAARTMSKIAKETEAHLDYNYLNQRLKEPAMYDFAEAISYSTCRTSNVLNAKAIVAATNSGSTAKLVSKYKPKCPIIAITPHSDVMRGLSLNFGVLPVLCQQFATTDDILTEAKTVVKSLNIAQEGDDIIVAAGMPTNYTGGTNMLKIEKV